MGRYELLKTAIKDGFMNVNMEETKSQLGAFIVMEAQAKLEEVIKLMETLDVMQDKYMEKAKQFIEENDDAEIILTTIPSVIQVISACLKESNDLIFKVFNDKDVMNFTIVDASDKSINIGNNTTETKIALEDPVSRAKVRDTVSKMLEYIKTNSPEPVSVTNSNNIE